MAGKGLLNCEDKVDWRNCVLDKQREGELTDNLKHGFKAFDFTAEDDEEKEGEEE